MSTVYILIIGAVSGWLAGQVMKNGGYGLLAKILSGFQLGRSAALETR